MEQLDLESSNFNDLDENFDGIYSNVTAPSADQINAGVAAATTAAQLISTLPKNAAKQSLKAACGRKPIFNFTKAQKAKQGAYFACNQKFNAANAAANNPAPVIQTPFDTSGGGNSGTGTSNKDTSQDNTPPPPAPKKFLGMPMAVGIGVTIGVVILVGVGGFLLYKKFGSKGAAPVAAAV